MEKRKNGEGMWKRMRECNRVDSNRLVFVANVYSFLIAVVVVKSYQ